MTWGVPDHLLWTPGERVGWTFRDRLPYWRRYPEPPPMAPAPPPGIVLAAQHAGKAFTRGLIWTAGVAGLLVLVPCCGVLSDALSNSAWWLWSFAVLGAAAGAVVLQWIIRRAKVRALTAAQERLQAELAAAMAGWQARRLAFELAEQQRMDAMAEWGAIGPGQASRRIDVVGGNLWSWEAFLTVYGASVLGSDARLTVIDLSGEMVCRELADLAARRDVSTNLQQLPAGLADSDLLADLQPEQIVDVLVEAINGGTRDGDQDHRIMDHRILTSVAEALEGDPSPARLVAGVRVAMGEPGPTPELSAAERLHLADEVFSAEYRREALGRLQRIEAYLYPLRAMATRREVGLPSTLTCLAVTDDGANASGQLLRDLIVQWLTRRVADQPDSDRTLILAGADDLSRRHLERLADVCDRRQVRLVLMFRHLREASLQVVGTGAVVFMKLGNHEEATEAANFIGRGHKFVLSQLTHQLGGNKTHTEGDSSGFSETMATQFSTTRSWGTTRSYAEGISWSGSETRQRVYEYTVEPRTIQDLPDYGMLLVQSSLRGPILRAVECNPEIVTLPRVSMQPLPTGAAWANTSGVTTLQSGLLP